MYFVVIADKMIRKRVAKLMRDKRVTYPSFQSAIAHVLKDEAEIWKDAEADARDARPVKRKAE